MLSTPGAAALLLVQPLAAPPGAAPCPDPARQVFGPTGAFLMGSDAHERGLARTFSSPETVAADWFSAEMPLRRVETEAFCGDRLLVTQPRYARFIARMGHRAPGISREQSPRQGFLVHDYERGVTSYLWRRGAPPSDKAQHPVVLVSVADAEAFCRWQDPGGRLPSEAEWEKAARVADGRIFPWGDGWDPLRLNSAARGPAMTTPVGQYPSGASLYTLLDAVGNVFQWTSRRLPDGRHGLKGCAWDDDAGLCRPAARHGRPRASRHNLIGFRCVQPASSGREAAGR
jgi:formylglycine-generating enzyme required for sulfatase activity